MYDFTKPITEEEDKTDYKNHEVLLFNEDTELEIASGTMIIVIDLSKKQYPLSSKNKSLVITRSKGRLETVPETTIFYNLAVYASLPKAE